MLFNHFYAGEAPGQQTIRISERLQVKEGAATRTEFIHTGIPRGCPVSFAKAPNGYVYIASGTGTMVKWDGIKTRVVTVGVTKPAAALTLGTSSSGSLTGRYTTYCRFIDEDGNVSDLSPISNEVVVTSIGQFDYTDVPVPSEQKVVRKQILRNTNGQTAAYYVDIDTTDLNATVLSSTRTDGSLRLQTIVPLFDPRDRLIANLHGLPPDDKPIVIFYNSRLFCLGDVKYEEGHAEVTKGSTSVVGITTEFTSGFVGRFLYVVGEKNSYEIDSVDVATQTLTLTGSYRGSTDTLAQYAIRSAPARRGLVFWTEPGEYDSWPATNSLNIASSDDLEDEIVGAIVNQSFIYILQHRHIYRQSYLQDPLTDGGVFLAARRGCINDRCWVNVDGDTYVLDERGVYSFDGGDDVKDLSQAIQDIFWVDQLAEPFNINWSASKFFHAVHRRSDCTIRWFVALSGDRYPRHCLVYNYQQPQWWIEECPWAVPSSVEMRESITHPVVAGNPGQFYVLGVGPLDVTRPEDGDTRGSVVTSTLTSLTTADLTMPSSGMVGAPIGIVSGTGKNQIRLISSVSGQRINITQPWNIQPDSTSKFQVGAIPWRWKSPWMDWILTGSNQARRVTGTFLPMADANQFDMRIYRDYSASPEIFALDWPRISTEASGLTIKKGSPDAEFDLTQEKGYVRLRLDSWKEVDEWRGDLVAVEIRGVGGASTLKIYGMYVEGAQ